MQMTEKEFIRWQNVISDAIAGKWLTIIEYNMDAAKRDFNNCIRVCDAIGVAYRAYRHTSDMAIVIGGDRSDGSIEFRTMLQEMRRCGDPRIR